MGRPVPTTVDEALQAARMRELLAPIVDRQRGRMDGGDLAIEPLRRRLIRYTVGSPEGELRVIGKVYDTVDEGRRAYDLHHRVWAEGFNDREPTAVRIPEPHGYVPELRLLLMEEAPGRSLKKLVKKGLAGEREIQLFAAALAKLHATPIVVGTPLGIEQHLAERCAGLDESLADTVPDLANDVRKVVRRARAWEADADQRRLTLCHGDFHFAQAHLAEDRLWLLDLDPLHHGDPGYDLAMVLVAFKQLEHKKGDGEYLRRLREAFVERYFSRMDWDVARSLPVHEAMIHLKRACKRLRWQDEPGWQETIRVQIREAADCMAALDVDPPRSLAELAELYDRCPGGV